MRYIPTYTCDKNCHKNSHGFQNWMSSWGCGSKFTNLEQVCDFSIFGSKSVTFYFFLFFLRVFSSGFQFLMSSWGSGSKFSNLQQVGDFSIFGSKSVTFFEGKRILKRILNLISKSVL